MLTINPNVVKSLMTLRGITVENLANLIHAKESLVWEWLEDSEPADRKPTPQIEKEIMTLLGMADSKPRGDVVHYWRVQEDYFCNVSETYAALYVMLEIFGEAKIVHIARDSDKVVSTSSKAVFGLQFDTFFALLEITGHPWRSIRFDVKEFPRLEWASSSPIVAISAEEYDSLEPGAMSVFTMNKRVQFSTEVPLWDSLRELALDKGVSANEVMSLLRSAEGGALLQDDEHLKEVMNASVVVPTQKPAEVAIPNIVVPHSAPSTVEQEAMHMAETPVVPKQVSIPVPVPVPAFTKAPSVPAASANVPDDFTTPIRR